MSFCLRKQGRDFWPLDSRTGQKSAHDVHNFNLARSLEKLGSIELDLKNPDRAIEPFDEALELRRTILVKNEEENLDLAEAMLSFVLLKLLREESQEALVLLEESLEIWFTLDESTQRQKAHIIGPLLLTQAVVLNELGKHEMQQMQ